MTEPSQRPLCVDLDGTLTPVDTLHESLVALAGAAPFALLRVPGWLARGKPAFKREVCARAPVDAEALPLHPELLAWLQEQKAGGRRLVLATASDRRTAEAVARRVGVFDEVVATDGAANLAGEGKRRALVERFGERGYDYAGNGSTDVPVWASAENAIVVGSDALAAKAAAVSTVTQRFAPQKAGLRTWIKAARLHQWVKNALIFIPPLLAHQLHEPATLIAALLAFLAFGLCASSVYLFNDLLDLPSDRRHARKRLRPFASGALPAQQGVMVGLGLLLASALIALSINVWFALALTAYYVFTWAYSLRLKRYALIDVMMLAGLYTMRIIAGSAATLIWPSFWLLGFSVFLFLSLGIVKRYAELEDARQAGRMGAHGRGYTAADLGLLQSLGTAAGYSAVVVMALYVNSAVSADLYTHPKALWMLCPVMLFWVSRVWLLTARGQMHDDPIVFALKDRVSLALAGLMGLGVYLAS
jgi:4-hydroxybenzoate polyprenyltransferase/phosphoserine phosphatase